MKAQRAARLYAQDQAALDKLLRQFSPARRAQILERLRPHLTFNPKST